MLAAFQSGADGYLRDMLQLRQREVPDAEITGSDSQTCVMWEVRRGELALQTRASAL